VLERREGEWVPQGGLVWGQDELGVVEDLIAGWHEEEAAEIADVSTTHRAGYEKTASKL